MKERRKTSTNWGTGRGDQYAMTGRKYGTGILLKRMEGKVEDRKGMGGLG